MDKDGFFFGWIPTLIIWEFSYIFLEDEFVFLVGIFGSLAYGLFFLAFYILYHSLNAENTQNKS